MNRMSFRAAAALVLLALAAPVSAREVQLHFTAIDQMTREPFLIPTVGFLHLRWGDPVELVQVEVMTSQGTGNAVAQLPDEVKRLDAIIGVVDSTGGRYCFGTISGDDVSTAKPIELVIEMVCDLFPEP